MLGPVSLNPHLSRLSRLKPIDRLHRLGIPGQHLDEEAAADSAFTNLTGNTGRRLLGLPRFDYRDDVAALPNAICYASGHRRRHAKRFMNAGKIVEPRTLHILSTTPVIFETN
jgi:hypothetical protein